MFTPLTDNKLILVLRPTRVDDLLVRFNTLKQAQFYIEHLGIDFSDYLWEHQTYYQAVEEVKGVLRELGHLQVLPRSFLPNFLFGTEDVVVVLGQDGLVANTLKYLVGQPVIGVNPDPKRWEGVLLPFQVSGLAKVMRGVLSNRHAIKEITMAKVTLNNGEVLYGVNDLFIGNRSHVSARYRLCLEGCEERQSSSGVIVSTGLGSTGWFKSLITGAIGISRAFMGNSLKIQLPESDKGVSFPWDADYLYFTVREPFVSVNSGSELVLGRIPADGVLEVVSEMAEGGVIFSDGIEQDFLQFNAGTSATVSLAEKRGRLVV